MSPVNLVIIGAGSRGTRYASYAIQHPDRARVVGVAEPRKYYRENLANVHNIPRQYIKEDWRQLADLPKFADAVVIATPDAIHSEPAISFSGMGYHILLEKPMAPTEAECHAIVDAVKKSGVLFSVCHVLLYTPYTRKLEHLLDDGVIGDIVSIQRLEPIGYWHHAHSYVRGNWRDSTKTAPMLLTKACHDLDWIRYIMGVPCKSISSFGSLSHFHKDMAPLKAGERCLDCDYEPECPYSALKIYLGRVRLGETGWPVNILTPNPDETNVLQALKYGPYGRCVYHCDNNVVDQQVVNMLFLDGQTASFTMTGFTKADYRQTRIFGTRGEIIGNGSQIRVFDFLSDNTKIVEPEVPENNSLSGHGGGDYGLMDNFVAAVAENNPQRILSGPQETLESHLMVFAAERARLENRVVDLMV